MSDDSLNLAPASVDDYRALARQRLPRQFFDYIDGGSHDELTLAANRAALHALRLRQRVMRDVSSIDTGVTLLGREAAMPLALAPIGLAGLMAPRAEAVAARVAEAAGVPFCLSTVGVCSIEEVRAATGAPFWFQLYMMRDRGYVRELLQRAQAAGCGALVFAVDMAVLATRYRDVRNGIAGGLSLAGKLRKAWDIASHPGWVRRVAIGGKPLIFGNLAAAVPDARSLPAFKAWVDSQFDASVTWRDLDFVREHWQGPLLIKGVMDVGDARAAAACGAQGLIVSNHGGRQLDGAPPTIEVLPAIAQAVGGQIEILMDSGVRSGQDIVKALASGSRATLVGRPWIWAMAGAGEAGLTNLLQMLRREIETTLMLTGTPAAREVSRDLLC